MQHVAGLVQVMLVWELGKNPSGGSVTLQDEFTGNAMLLLYGKDSQSIQLEHIKWRRLISLMDC